jgi:hypothetical protein
MPPKKKEESGSASAKKEKDEYRDIEKDTDLKNE